MGLRHPPCIRYKTAKRKSRYSRFGDCSARQHDQENNFYVYFAGLCVIVIGLFVVSKETYEYDKDNCKRGHQSTLAPCLRLHTHTYILSLSLSLSLSLYDHALEHFPLSLSLALSPPLSHSLSRARTLSLSFFFSFSLSASLSHTHTHTWYQYWGRHPRTLRSQLRMPPRTLAPAPPKIDYPACQKRPINTTKRLVNENL